MGSIMAFTALASAATLSFDVAVRCECSLFHLPTISVSLFSCSFFDDNCFRFNCRLQAGVYVH
jgi:hypothetical protein